MRDQVQQLEQQNGLLRNQTINLSNPYAIGRKARGYGMVPANAITTKHVRLTPARRPEAGPHREEDGGPPAAACAGALAGGLQLVVFRAAQIQVVDAAASLARPSRSSATS